MYPARKKKDGSHPFKQSDLEKLCQEYETARKIEMIVTGILRKNYKSVRQLEKIETRAKEMIERMKSPTRYYLSRKQCN